MEVEFKSGTMPDTDFTYEDFEGFLASYYLTYQHFIASGDEVKNKSFEKLAEILKRFAKRHGVQMPEDAILTMRAKEDWGKPKKLGSYFSVKDSFNAFRTDFGLMYKPEDMADIKELWELISSPVFEF